MAELGGPPGKILHEGLGQVGRLCFLTPSSPQSPGAPCEAGQAGTVPFLLPNAVCPQVGPWTFLRLSFLHGQ